MAGNEDPRRLKKHDEIRVYLDGDITRASLKALKDSAMTLGWIKPKISEDIKDFSDLFNVLCENGKIEVGKYGNLIDLLEMHRFMALAKYLADAEAKFPEPEALPKSVEETQKPKSQFPPDVGGFAFNDSSVPPMGKDLADPDNLPQDPNDPGGYYTRGSDTAGLEVEEEAKEQLGVTKDNTKSTTECDPDDVNMKEGLPSSQFQEASYGLSQMTISSASTDPPPQADDRAEEAVGGNHEPSSIGQLPQQEKDSSKTTTECDTNEMKEGLPSSQFQGGTERPTQQPSQQSDPSSADAPPAPRRPTAEVNPVPRPRNDATSEPPPTRQGDLEELNQEANVSGGGFGNIYAGEVEIHNSSAPQSSRQNTTRSSVTGNTSTEVPPAARPRLRVVNQKGTSSGHGSFVNIFTPGKFTKY